MSFQTDYSGYLASFKGGPARNDAGVLWLSLMDGYSQQGLLVTDPSRNVYIPAYGSGLTVAESDLPPMTYPGLYQAFNPKTGQAWGGYASGLYADYVPQPGVPIPFGVAQATPDHPYTPLPPTTSPVMPTPQPTAPPPTAGGTDISTLIIYGVLGYMGLKALGVLK